MSGQKNLDMSRSSWLFWQSNSYLTWRHILIIKKQLLGCFCDLAVMYYSRKAGSHRTVVQISGLVSPTWIHAQVLKILEVEELKGDHDQTLWRVLISFSFDMHIYTLYHELEKKILKKEKLRMQFWQLQGINHNAKTKKTLREFMTLASF